MSVSTSLLILVLTACTPDAPKAVPDGPPATVSYLYKRDLKPPLRSYGVNLVIKNRHQKPTWFLIRYWGGEPLTKKNQFTSRFGSKQPFGGQEYVRDGKRVALIRHYGEDKFIAFQLPANATIEFSAYEIEAWDTIKAFEIWEVSSLKVNGKTPLDKWLPYNTLSDNKAKIPKRQDWNNLDFDYKRSRKRTDYRKEVVKTISVSVIRRWTIPIAVKNAP